MSERSDVLVGIRVSAILLVALGCATAMCALFLIIATCMLVINNGFPHWRSSVASVFVPGAIATAAASYLCFRAVTALYKARRWGAYVAIIGGVFLVVFGSLAIFDFYHPLKQAPDEYFVFPIALLCIVLGLWWSLYLNLPHVRSHLGSQTD